MFDWVVKLQRHGEQYRVTLPKKLVAFADLDDAEYLRLESGISGGIIIKEYHGKGKEKGDVPENQA